MKSLLQTTLAAGLLLTGVGFTSCQQDKCMSVVCAHNGECNSDGSCTCAIGYEGERCETITRDKFKGSWNVVEDGSISNPDNYTLSIQNAPEINQVYIRNFNNFSNATVVARVHGDTIYIPNQIIEQGGRTRTVEGKGYFVFEEYYGLHGNLEVKYRVINEDGTVNDFGYRGAGSVSKWTK